MKAFVIFIAYLLEISLTILCSIAVCFLFSKGTALANVIISLLIVLITFFVYNFIETVNQHIKYMNNR